MTVSRRLVVTVDRRGPRLNEFLRQKGASGFEVFDGVDLRASTHYTVASLVDADAVMRRYGRTLAPGEVGCALSHRAVMSAIAADGSMSDRDVALVVEDDAVLDAELEPMLPWLVAQPFDLMPLHHGSATRLGMPAEAGSRIMDRLYPLSPLAARSEDSSRRVGVTTPESWMLTVGYLIRKRAAVYLTQVEMGPLSRVADDYRVVVDLGLRVCQVRPGLISESTSHASVITPSGRVLAGGDQTEREVIERMQAQAASTQLRRRKLAWLVAHDLSTRLPWPMRHSVPMDAFRRGWNAVVPRLPARVRHVLRPGIP